MRQKPKRARINAYESLLKTVGRSPKIRDGFLVQIDKLIKPFRETISLEIQESGELSKRAGLTFESMFKTYRKALGKDPYSPKVLAMMITALFEELQSYRMKNAFLLSLVFNMTVALADEIPEKSGKRGELAKTLRLQIASQVLRSGALGKALDKLLAQQLEESQSKLLPYVG